MVSQQVSSTRIWLSAARAALPCAAVLACSGTDVGYPRASAITACATGGASSEGGSVLGTGGSGNTPNRGTGGTLGPPSSGGSKSVSSGGTGGANYGGEINQGGVVGSGGSNVSGASNAGSTFAGGTAAGGTATGGSPAGGNATGGAASTGFPWPAAYDPTAMPTPADGHHNPGTSCMSSVCHGTKVPFAYGGTVYKADGITGAPNVQVGISSGGLTLVTYTAANGNIWLPSSAGAVTWAGAAIAIRNAKGEKLKPTSAPREAACNGTGCHNSAQRLIEP